MESDRQVHEDQLHARSTWYLIIFKIFYFNPLDLINHDGGI